MPRDGDGDSPLFGLSQRLPPSNVQAEQAVLGALLASNKTYHRICDVLRPEQFSDPIHKRIYEAIERRIQGGQLADAVTLKAEFEHSAVLDQVGGTAYLAQLLTAMVAPLTAAPYAVAIQDAWLRRQVIELGEQAINDGFGGTEDGHGSLQVLITSALRLAETARGRRRSTRMGDAVLLRQDAATPPPDPLMTGIKALDELWHGLWPGTLDILAGRPGSGKTSLALQIARAVATQFLIENMAENAMRAASGMAPIAPRTVEFWSMEMPAIDLGVRAMALDTGIPADRIRTQKLHPLEAGRLVVAQREWRDLPIVIHDEPPYTLEDIALEARVAKQQNRMGLAITDHAGKYRPAKRRFGGDTEFMSEIGSVHHDLAVTLGVPWLLLWQLGRDIEKREDAKPRLSDLKYAGEADADNVIMLHRPSEHMGSAPARGRMSADAHARAVSEWESDRDSWQGKAWVAFVKRRAGPTGHRVLGFDGVATRFFDLPTAGLWEDVAQ